MSVSSDYEEKKEFFDFLQGLFAHLRSDMESLKQAVSDEDMDRTFRCAKSLEVSCGLSEFEEISELAARAADFASQRQYVELAAITVAIEKQIIEMHFRLNTGLESELASIG